MGAAKGGEDSKHPQNAPVTVPNPKFRDVKLGLGLRELRAVFSEAEAVGALAPGVTRALLLSCKEMVKF